MCIYKENDGEGTINKQLQNSIFNYIINYVDWKRLLKFRLQKVGQDIKFNDKIIPGLIQLAPENFIFYVKRKNTLLKFNL